MAAYNYPKFKIRIAPDSQKRQGLRTGDIVRRQYADGETTRYSLMVVLDTGIEAVLSADGKELLSPYFIGALIEGDEPRDGELLDFVRMTSLSDEDRSGALYLTSSDAEAPYLDVIDGMASERSLCRPDSIGPAGYTFMGREQLDAAYISSEEGYSRICTLQRNAVPGFEASGLRQTLPTLEHPQRIVISFWAKTNSPLTQVPLVVGYADGSETDGEASFDVDTEWNFHLFSITIDTPPSRERNLRIDLAGHLTVAGDTLHIASLNVVLQSDLSNFASASKARVGRITGIADPLFGVLDGYGAYFQNLYATRNVNVAGTLTAGDENGFGSTFYVGRIHKNALVNSLSCNFETPMVSLPETPPSGIGNIHRLTAGDHLLRCQDEAWTAKHAGESYCFSFWCRSEPGAVVVLKQDRTVIGSIDAAAAWLRRHVAFKIVHRPGQALSIMLSSEKEFDFTSPQLEPGSTPSLYQPTDEVLNFTDEYGAWFSRGGIGGTIQHPLLRLNDDGSLESRDGSFVINADGTGHFAGGRFRWTQDTIELRGVTIRWENFDEEAQEALRPKSVSITGCNAFHYADALSPTAEPSQITLVASELNFMAEARRWDYLGASGDWKDAGGRDAAFLLTPGFHGWEGRDVLTLRYTATFDGQDYAATISVTKLYDGESAYSVYIRTDRGTVLQNGIGETLLLALVMRGAEEVTDFFADESFLWTRQSDDPEDDVRWNSAEHHGRTLLITGDDVTRKAVFNCEITLTNS